VRITADKRTAHHTLEDIEAALINSFSERLELDPLRAILLQHQSSPGVRNDILSQEDASDVDSASRAKAAKSIRKPLFSFEELRTAAAMTQTVIRAIDPKFVSILVQCGSADC